MRERWRLPATLRSSRQVDTVISGDMCVDSEQTACESRMLVRCAESNCTQSQVVSWASEPLLVESKDGKRCLQILVGCDDVNGFFQRMLAA